MPELAYLNEMIVPVDEAKVPVRDRGFIFGDGVYDVARVYDVRPHRLGAHIERLRRCARQIELCDIPSEADLERIVDELLDASGLSDAMLYMQLTRGAAPRKSAYPAETPATLFVSVERVRRGADKFRDTGVEAILVEDIRWDRNDIKSINLLPKVLMGQRAHKAGVYEALYHDADGHVWEGTSTNLFAIIDGALQTAPEGPRILSGTTRRDVLELAERLGYDCELRPLTEEQLRSADELFVTGTLTEVQGLVAVDGTAVGSGEVGSITREFQEAYDELVEDRLRQMS
ncbi:D-amino acid aminotransferase [Persicimonas caeni]|uniref:D-amino acid aminotransferase n=1 Tax=Persicimonas caeni TaxID=2292766 RepID=A0A4Y6Q0Z1_PERCE|nr:aminotransferase class IV [Persicimonas caeni]QDG54192.1 D-amino acid aminotransferase [Persicimonas caeni]QED35413.1 D-amino acid aminotransferase [Persicimonas caeni]